MKRFDYFGSKLSNNIDFPLHFSFEKEYMSTELQHKEDAGYIENEKHPGLFEKTSNNSSTVSDGPKTHRYELISMIIHHGYSASRGHYYSLIKVQSRTPM
jgi:hypothetical protein